MARGLHLTIDEWFYHWFENEKSSKLISAFFIEVLDVCDKIVLQKGTRLAQKFYALCEDSVYYPPIERRAVKLLIKLIITNIDKVYWVEETVSLSEEIANRLPRKDVYLIEMCLQTHDKILITTDEILHQNVLDLINELGIKTFLADDFILNYPKILNNE